MTVVLKLLKKGLKHPEKIIENLKNVWRNHFVDIFIVSFPKTGRTWLRILIGKALCEHFRIDEKLLLDTYQLTKLAGIQRSIFTHDGPFNLPDFSSYQRLTFHHRHYQNRKVIFLIRDIRDTIVSLYFQHTKRTFFFTGDLHEFIRDERFGIKKVITFYNVWYQNRHIPEDFLLIRYEDLSQAPKATLHEIMIFLGDDDIQPDILQQAVTFSSFENMKHLEQKNYFNDSILRQELQGDNESFKVRRGKIGGYRDYLDREDVHYIKQTVQKLGLPNCNWYFAPELA